MHVDEQGSGDAPALLCLHGGTGTGRYHWRAVARDLSEDRRVLMPDLPGHGRTPLPPQRAYDVDLLADAVHELLDELERPTHVAAFSLGGHAALRLAARAPERFASLTLIGVSWREHEGLRRWREEFDPDALEQRQPLWVRTLAKLHEPQGGPDAWREVTRRDARGSLRVELDPERLRDLDCPVLLVRGDRDTAVEAEQYAHLRRLWGDRAEELVVPHGGHDVQMTRHAFVSLALRDFLERSET